MQLILSNRGNPDHGQNPDWPVYGTASDYTVAVKDLAEAKEKCAEYIKYHNLGGSNWTGGQVLEKENTLSGSYKLIAYISYNGRIWKNENCKEEIIL